MACHLVGTKPLSAPMLPCCQLDPKEHISVKIQKFCFKEMHVQMSSAERPFCLDLNVFRAEVTREDIITPTVKSLI